MWTVRSSQSFLREEVSAGARRMMQRQWSHRTRTRAARALGRFVATAGVALSLWVPCVSGAPCSPDAHEPDDACATSPTILLSGAPLTGDFCDDASDWTRFNACAGRRYVVQTSGLGASVDTVLELYGGDCSTLIVSDDDGNGGGASRLAWTAPADGTYHVRV